MVIKIRTERRLLAYGKPLAREPRVAPSAGRSPPMDTRAGAKDALQLLINRYGYICFAQVPERVSTKSFVVLVI